MSAESEIIGISVEENVVDASPFLLSDPTGSSPSSWDTPVPRESVPDVLLHLCKNGTEFRIVSPIMWSRDNDKPKLIKRNSGYFSVDTIVTSQEIVEAFDKAGISPYEISSIPR